MRKFNYEEFTGFPIDPPTLEQAQQDYVELRNFDSSSLTTQGGWFSRSVFDCPQQDVYIGSSNVGLKASGLHHWTARIACDSVNSPSPIRSWCARDIRATLENSIYFEKNPKTAIALRKYIASQFRPTAATAIYRYFKAKDIYDPCGGWGDRMIGAQAANLNYFAREVNPLVVAGYHTQKSMYRTKGLIGWEYAQCELSPPAQDFFDLSFTSPPYFRAEKYQGSLSSHLLYKKYDEWVSEFLKPTVHHCWDAVKVGGHVAFNISDVYMNHTVNHLCQPVVDAFRELGGEPYAIGYKMAKRPQSSADKDGVFCEPIIVCRKV